MRSINLFMLVALPVSTVACIGQDNVAGEGADEVTTATSALYGAVVNPPAPACPMNSPGPGSEEVYIYQDSGFAITNCRVLTLGLYPTTGHLNLPQDSISSIKVGSGVRFRSFRDTTYGGGFIDWLPGNWYSALSSYGWGDSISSGRVIHGNRLTTCLDLQDQEFAMFRDRNLTGDCVVLLANTNSYATANDMGIAQDSVSSVFNNSDMHLTFMADSNFHHTGIDYTVVPRWFGDLPHDVGSWPFARVNAIEDSASSVKVTFGPPVW